ncbi:hypothetical protein [Mesorhizobium retamae]|uniref:DUF2178 domain-containing protein n=1 Tax=Mesorhizobium retamae TaxID=2912854 RepID=A0ABS9QHJ1_9HYPH|nr:hypothetical protein [Mesorhizobium sp. IRAMC:0171]MCG7506914.1 hypothetical protein [Mesorhizobium sp. IRAMC:0171]
MAISERASRILYGIEFVIFALIPICALAAWALFYGAGSILMFLFALMMLVSSNDSASLLEALRNLAIFAAIVALTGMGLIAIWKFLRLSAAFGNHGSKALQELRETYWRCLAWAALPLLATTALFPYADPDFSGGLLLFSGVTLCVPLFHLWLELRYRGNQG